MKGLRIILVLLGFCVMSFGFYKFYFSKAAVGTYVCSAKLRVGKDYESYESQPLLSIQKAQSNALEICKQKAGSDNSAFCELENCRLIGGTIWNNNVH